MKTLMMMKNEVYDDKTDDDEVDSSSNDNYKFAGLTAGILKII